jgi:hypothetical protein
MCAFAPLSPFAACQEQQRNQEHEPTRDAVQKQQDESSTRGAGRIGAEGLRKDSGPGSREEQQQKRERESPARDAGQQREHERSPHGPSSTSSTDLRKDNDPRSKGAAPLRQQEDVDCDCSRRPSRGPMPQEAGMQRQHADALKWKAGDEEQHEKVRRQDGQDLAQTNHTSGRGVVNGTYKQEGSNPALTRKHDGRNNTRNGNQTGDREKDSHFRSAHGKGEQSGLRETKGKCGCTQTDGKSMSTVTSKTNKARNVSHGCNSRNGSSKRSRNSGRFLQERGPKAGCDEDDDVLPVPVILGAAGAGIGALCITVGLLCVCCTRSFKTPASLSQKESAAVVVICDVKKPTCEGVVSTSAGVVVGNPASNA